MTDDTSRVPKLRFPGFAGAWEQRKLSDLFIEGGSGGTPKSTNKAFYDGDIPFLGISDITKSNGFINNTEKHISSDGLNSSAAWIVSKGAISLAMYASVGKLAILNIDAATSQAFYNMIFDDYDLRDLVYQRLNKANELSEWNKLISTGTQSNLNADKVKNFQMYLPKNHDEIKLISTFFKQIDNTIDLHQRKLSHLRQLKKGLLQKMFPKSGEDRPEVRFPGFADAWEQRKLRDYLVPSKEKNSALSYGKDEVLSVSGDAGVVNQIQFQGRSYAGASTKDYGVVQTGDVIYTKSPLKKNPFGIIKTNKGKAGIVSTLYAVYKPKDNTYTPFVEVYFDDDARLNNYLRPLVNKGAKNDMKVSKSGALTGLICFPGATEQRMLSEFFQQLEDLITLHQRKLSHLQQQKKALLQQMFV
ncbi:restriction endonuclease subunit S [Bifidobacterium mongoliense]|uniref:restriction endonuclease subunit S n=1 Tax=Bifidobacterium mongoliense TaxID=518643 RepID=UPI0030EE4A29